jgi:hypothetical protein
MGQSVPDFRQSLGAFVGLGRPLFPLDTVMFRRGSLDSAQDLAESPRVGEPAIFGDLSDEEIGFNREAFGSFDSEAGDFLNRGGSNYDLVLWVVQIGGISRLK